MTDLARLEAIMRDRKIVACNIHLGDDGFRIHVRHDQSSGFHCAQRGHESLLGAINEHFGQPQVAQAKPATDLTDLFT